MRFQLIFGVLLSMFVQVSASTYAQEVTLQVENMPLGGVFGLIEQQTGYVFLYDDTRLKEQKISLSIQQAPIDRALEACLDGMPISFKIIEKNVLLRRDDTKLLKVHSAAVSQPAAVAGYVADSLSRPLQGVSVALRDSGRGTTTDEAGRFQLSVAEGDVLVFSLIGYQQQEVTFAGQQSLSVVLRVAVSDLEEVVVVGYGTQKKINLTGAVDQIGGEVFDNRALVNVTQGLQGALPNLNISFADGKPTRAPAYNIRGTTSIGQGGSALVLIDGVEGDPTLINPNDIESVSILKDAASAAIYGARGVFGVVLITTKTPKKGGTEVVYSSNYSINRQAAKNDYVSDGYLWASMFSESFSAWNDYSAVAQNVNKSMKFSLDYLNELKRRSEDPSLPNIEVDPETGEYIYYANTDWYKELYKDAIFSHDQNLSLSGSTEKLTYFVSGRFINRPGIFKYNSDDFNSYNLRAKGTIQLLPWLTAHNNTSFSQTLYHNPLGPNETNIWRGVQYDAPPMAPMFNPDGTLSLASAYSVGGFWQGKSGIDTDKRFFSNMTNLTASFFGDKLRVKGDFSYQSTDTDQTQIRVAVPYSNIPGSVEYIGLNTNNISKSIGKSRYLVSNLYGEYENTLNDHYIKALLGGNYELSTIDDLSVSRNGLIYDGADNINLAFGQSILTNGGWREWNMVGGFFRFNYAYKNKYLAEVNGRYDGSSKFPSYERFAFFPSISLGWNISEEGFWNVSNAAVTHLKLRGSYGSLGNGNINPYVYNELYNVAQLGRILNGTRPQYTNQAAVLPDGLTWETSTTTNLGLDAAFINGKLSVTADGYIRKTTDMFTTGVTLPAVFGAGSPKGNYADLETRGWEVTVGWRDQFAVQSKPFHYSVRLGVSDYVSEILKFNNPMNRLNDYYVGQRIGEIWGFETGGFFNSAEEVASWADQSLYVSSASGTSLPGDIKFIDRNGDGVINMGDDTVDDPGDRTIIGNSEPRYRFGINLNASWNNFSFGAFFQGVGKQDWYPDRNAAPFWGQYVAQYANVPSFQLGNIWSENNPDAYFPRYRAYIALGANRTLGQAQTRYLQNAAYVRLKNVQLGYSLPKPLLSKTKLQQVQVYLSAENLWTFSPFYKLTEGHIDVENIWNADPELGAGGGGGHAYPILKSFTVGLKVGF